MFSMCVKENNINDYIKEAIYYLKENNYEKAYNSIKYAMIEDLSSGEIHNLLGIYYEKIGEFNMAKKHYRVSSDLNPKFNAPMKNLERLGSFRYIFNDKYIDYGDGI